MFGSIPTRRHSLPQQLSREQGVTTMAINVTDLNNRCVTTSTVGYMALALTGWMLSMTAAGWYEHIYLPGTSLMLPFALLR